MSAGSKKVKGEGKKTCDVSVGSVKGAAMGPGAADVSESAHEGVGTAAAGGFGGVF